MSGDQISKPLHEYEVVKEWFDKACLTVRDAHDRGELSDKHYQDFNFYTANLASAVEELVNSLLPRKP